MAWSLRSHAPSLPWGFLVLLTMLLSIAALWDLRRRRIPNAVSAAVLGSGLVAQVSAGGWTAALAGAAAGVAVIALLWRPWQRGRLGGGDVKLAAAAAAWTGLGLLPEYILATTVAGGLVGGACYALSATGVRREVRRNLRFAVATMSAPDVPIRGGDGRLSVPYGMAAAAGALLVAWIGRPWI